MDHKLIEISQALQKIPENELTKTIIKPLFQEMGFHKVEFYGGTDEEGKDLLIWEKDKFDDLKLSVAQVKHFKFSNSAGDSKSLQTIINQLTVCFAKSVFFSDKSSHLPFEAILISSHQIDSKNIKSRFDSTPTLIDRKIRIIDGLKLAELLIKNCPKLVNKLIDTEIDFSYFSEATLDNRTLLKALSFDYQVALKNIYTDIDFSLGKMSTRLFFNNTFEGLNKKFDLDRNDWDYFKISINDLDNEIKEWLLDLPISVIEANFNQEMDEYDQWKKIAESYNEESNENKKLFQILSKKYNNEKKLLLKKQGELSKLERIKNIDATGLIRIEKLRSDIKKLETLINPLTEHELEIERHERTILKHLSIEPETRYRFRINGYKLGDWLIKQRSLILDRLKVYNSHKPSEDELKSYLLKCSTVFANSAVLLRTKECSESLNLNKEIVRRLDFESARFKLSIDRVFDTGLNLTLLGLAGGGKTTSLQMYALDNIANQDKIVIWAPLAQVVPNWKKNHSETKTEYKIQSLDIAVYEYLRSKDVEISIDKFMNTLKSKKVVILFDGLDEAMRSNEWLPEAINYIAIKYSSFIQVIVTSRMSGPFVERLNFFTITILPFTKEQRNQFIDKWFSGKDSEIKEKIKTHFAKNTAIDEITRNPLLTTTLCVLAKHELPLPQTEINLYSDRLKLLTGYYDNVKNIKTRITTSPHNLEFLAKKLGYYLHSKNRRDDSMENLESMAITVLRSKLNEVLSKVALQELIDPCNIVVPMSDTGRYGFGHLRYQEHLAALELVSNRNIDILGLLGAKLQWWRESLYFFAQMSDDLTWLITSIGHQIHNSKYKDILNELIGLRPKEEQEDIIKLFNKYKDDIGYFVEKNRNDFN